MSGQARQCAKKGLFVTKQMMSRPSSASVIQVRRAHCPRTPMPECKPCCVVKRDPRPPCKIPKQPMWDGCDRICLPCCEKVCLPLLCKEYTIGLNTCKKDEYHLPAYSECNKDLQRPCHKKECCYWNPLCHVGRMAHREVRPLVRIRVRQRRTLNGFRIS